MHNLKFNDFEDLAYDIVEKFDAIREIDDYNDISIIAKYEEARQIIKELLYLDFEINSCEIYGVDLDKYNDEYIISICNIGNENEVWCEPMHRDNGYLNDESSIIYILDNCSSKVISHCDADVIFEVSVGECDEYCKENIEENTHGFTVSKSDENGYSSYSFYSDNIELVEYMARLFR